MRDFARRVSTIAVVLTAAAGALIAGSAACGSAYGDADESDASDSAPSVTLGDDAAVPDPCAHTGPPAAPASDDSTDELPAFYMAVENIQLSATDGGTMQGFDLDGVCSCDTRAGAAFDGAASCMSPNGAACDLDGGIDNAASQLTTTLTPFYPIDSLAQRVIASGHRTLLIQVGKYNGQLNDREVAVGVALSDGIHTKADAGCSTSTYNPSKGTWSPCWDGNDEWALQTDQVIPGTSQPYLQALGYVANGVLVFRIPGLVTVPFDEAMSIEVGGTVLSGTLVPLGEDLQPRPRGQAPATDREKRLWTLTDATYGGRVAVTSLLTALGTITVPHDGGPNTYLCNEALFPTLRSAVCGGRDISANSSNDRLGLACDALSLAMHVTAFPAVGGVPYPGDATITDCTPSPTGEIDGGAMPYVCP